MPSVNSGEHGTTYAVKTKGENAVIFSALFYQESACFALAV